MISDDERREVAAKLRCLDEHIDGVPPMRSPQVHNAMALSAIRAVVGKGDIFHLLADLIDVPATRNVATDKTQCHAPQDFACERCGYWNSVDIGFTHCPGCGAEVVNDR